MDDAADLQAELDSLSAGYAARMPERIAKLEGAWDALHADWNNDGLRVLSREVHNLAGSGRTFGFAQLSDAARNLEECLREIAQAQSAPDGEQGDRVRVLLRELRQATLQGNVSG